MLREREREREISSSGSFIRWPCGQRLEEAETESQKSIQVSHVCIRDQLLGPSSAACRSAAGHRDRLQSWDLNSGTLMWDVTIPSGCHNHLVPNTHPTAIETRLMWNWPMEMASKDEVKLDKYWTRPSQKVVDFLIPGDLKSVLNSLQVIYLKQNKKIWIPYFFGLSLVPSFYRFEFEKHSKTEGSFCLFVCCFLLSLKAQKFYTERADGK